MADIGPTGEQEDSDMKLLLRSDLMHDEYLRNELVKEHRSRVVYHYWQMDCESTPSTHEALDMFLCNFTTRGDEIGCLEIEYDWETDFSQQEEPNADDKHTNNSIERDARKLSGIFTVLRCFGITTTVKLPGTPINRHPILERIRQLRVEVARDDGHSHFWLKPGWLATRELDKIVNDEELKRAFYNGIVHSPVMIQMLIQDSFQVRKCVTGELQEQAHRRD